MYLSVLYLSCRLRIVRFEAFSCGKFINIVVFWDVTWCNLVQATGASETVVSLYQVTWCHFPEHQSVLQNCFCMCMSVLTDFFIRLFMVCSLNLLIMEMYEHCLLWIFYLQHTAL
jgi:hypothetical protein